MAGQKFTLTFDAQLNVSQMKGALAEIQANLNKLQLPQNVGKGLQDTFSKLSSEVKKFEELSGQKFSSKADFGKLEKNVDNILKLYDKLKSQLGSIQGLDAQGLEKLFPEKVTKNIEAAKAALAPYLDALKKAQQEINKWEKKQSEAQSNLDAAKAKKPVSAEEYKATTDALKAVNQELDDLRVKQAAAIEAVEKKKASLKDPVNRPGKILPGLEEELKQITEQLEAVENKRRELLAKKDSTTTGSKQTEEIDKYSVKLEEAKTKLEEFKAELANLQSTGEGSWLAGLVQQFSQLTGIDFSQTEVSAQSLGEAIRTYINQQLQELLSKAGAASGSVEKLGAAFQGAAKDSADFANKGLNSLDNLRDVEALKSRIQYFFGLSNAVNLAKRAIRGAFDTIKDLDKAMTETAVVTNFSVKDMWSQLPAYTKQANELGVTTLEAYQAATLYYQQGLKANEVNALSTETLKMARIAGLEAAEATDRMTNALRGFNMELTAANAQRVDDVYSELAANTASNVDEISTAMTKVASLANNANMEFETTSAFLAQIIETTRESAETAGTALKTVVARFSEVKKLVDEGTLRGQDEEGEAIDVNKVGQALRTAGIDLNKYFLGEVGLDDIFMELASKWDSLTSLQQRYIATQAAGSRQQSRFIAMMSNYARTQELVGKAYASTGAAARQFEKTQESLQSKLARLKNAWNEFLMGLANNQIVKAAVDILTGLLNAVNSLTSAFGDGVGSILKWLTAIMAFSGLKSLFRQGGLVEKGLMSLLSGTSIGKDLAEKGLGQTAGQTFGQAFFSGFKNIGSKAWGGLTDLGSWISGGEFTGIAAGITGIATALTALAVAAAIANAAYTAWLRKTDAGQVKLANQYADSLNAISTNLQQSSHRAKEASEKIKDYNTEIKTAQTTKERDVAIQDQNDYIQSLIKEDSTYAQYIKTMSTVDGQIYLTLDESALAKAVDKIAEGALKAEAYSTMAAANASFEKSTLYANLLKNNGVNMVEGTRTAIKGIPLITSDLSTGTLAGVELTAYETHQVEQTPEERIYYSNLEANQVAAEIEARNQLRSAATQFISLEDQQLNANAITSITEAFAKGFDFDNLTEAIIKNEDRNRRFYDTDTINTEYERLYGAPPSEKLKEEDIWNSVATGQALEGQLGVEIPNLIKLVQNKNGQLILDVFNGVQEDFITSEQVRTAYDQLGAAGRATVDKLLGITGIENRDAQLDQMVEASNTSLENISQDYRQLLESTGEYNNQQLDYITKNIKKSQQRKIVGVVAALTDYSNNFQKTITQAYTQANLGFENLDTSFAQDVDADKLAFLDKISTLSNNPILLLQEINDAAVNGTESVQALAQELLSLNEEQFSKSFQVQTFLMSSEFDKLTEQVESFINTNGRITSDNVQELATSSQTLTALLNNTTVSATGLANILNAMADGSLVLTDINDNTVELANKFYDLRTAAAAAHEFIANFDFNSDYNEAYNFINQLVEKLKELSQAGSAGSMTKYFSALFSGLNLSSMDNLDKLIGLIEKLQGQEGLDLFSNIFGLPTSGRERDSSGLEQQFKDYLEKGGTDFGDFIKTSVTEWYKKQFKDGELGEDFNITDDYVNLIIENLLDHDIDNTTLEAIAKTTIQNILSSYLTGLDAGAPDVQNKIRQKLANLAKLLHLDSDQIREYLSGQTDENGEALSQDIIDSIWPEDLDVSNLDFSGSVESIRQALMTAISQGLITGLSKKDLIGKDSNELMQILIDNLGLKDGQFDLDTLKLNIGNLVPEVADGSFSVEEWINGQLKISGPIPIPVTYQVVKQKEDGSYEYQDVQVDLNISNLSDIEQGLKEIKSKAPNLVEALALNDAQQQVQAIATILADLGSNSKIASITSELAGAKVQADKLTSSLSRDVTKKVNIAPQQKNITIGSGSTTVTLSISAVKKGGIVQSAANGSIKPGLALTGEVAPEIIWNGEKGYAYLAGKDGPEINNLQPGDRIFNGEETRQILKRSGISSFAKGGIIPSYKLAGPGTHGGSSGGSGSGKDKKDDDWSNELDWLYNLLNDIAESERQQAIYAAKFEAALKDTSKTGRALYELTQQQLGKLISQRVGYEAQREQRAKELAQLEKEAGSKTVNGKKSGTTFSKYAQYNDTDNTVEIDWDKINKIKDKDQYDAVIEYIEKLESAKQSYDEAEQALLDINSQIEELQQQYLSKYLDFEKRVMDAVVAQYQENIDKLSELNDTINSTNADIISSMQEQINLERQIRDNTQKEQDISDMEAQLAFLQRDTSGANQTAILDLQEKLRDAQQDYSDTLLDQSIDQLSKSNEEAQKQREKQIEIMQSQLDYMQKNGLLWDEVHGLIAGGFTDSGSIKEGSDLYKLLQDADAWNGMSQAQRLSWADDLILETNQVGAYLLQELNGAQLTQSNIEKILGYMADATQYIAPLDYQDPASLSGPDKWRIRERAPGGKEGAYTWTQGQKDKYRQYSLTPEPIHYTDEPQPTSGSKLPVSTSTPTPPSTLTSVLASFIGGQTVEIKKKTDANTLIRNDDFLKLANVAPNWTNAVSKSTTTTNAPVTFNLDVQVDQLANDYDVDELVSRLKEDLYNSAMYKNGNVLSLLR